MRWLARTASNRARSSQRGASSLVEIGLEGIMMVIQRQSDTPRPAVHFGSRERGPPETLKTREAVPYWATKSPNLCKDSGPHFV